MKHILVNLKRFDIPRAAGGVNDLAGSADWADTIISGVREGLAERAEHEFVFFFPELHLHEAVASAADSPIGIGCQGVSRRDTAVGGGFGAFTTERTANAMAAAGVGWALVGHSEERAALREILTRFASEGEIDVAGFADAEMNARAQAAQTAGLRVVLCIGEQAAERDRWEEVITAQVRNGLAGLDKPRLLLAYEPIWAIGPGRTPPGADQIRQVAQLVKQLAPDVPLVYGGGLKTDNAAMLAGIPEIDGGLIALTRFTGEIGFRPDEYLEIVNTYFGALGAQDAN